MQHLVVEMRESDLSRFYIYWKYGMYDLRMICNATILCLRLTIEAFDYSDASVYCSDANA